MNTAMFYFYLAGVVESVDGWLLGFILSASMVTAVFAVAGVCERVENDTPTIHNFMMKHAWKIGGAVAAAAVLAALIPTKEFFYTVAGLKAGETAVSTELGQKAVDLIEQQIDHLLETPE